LIFSKHFINRRNINVFIENDRDVAFMYMYGASEDDGWDLINCLVSLTMSQICTLVWEG